MSLFKRKTAKPAEADGQTGAPKEVKPKEVKKTSAIKAKQEEKRNVIKAQSGSVSAQAARTLLAPLVTEKTAHLSDAGVYVFRVPLSANRIAVRDSFKELYKVTPTAVNIIRVHGKESRSGRFASRASDWKKALITLPAGSRVDIFAL